MKHLMVDLATLLVSSCSIYVPLVLFGVCGSSVRGTTLALVPIHNLGGEHHHKAY